MAARILTGLAAVLLMAAPTVAGAAAFRAADPGVDQTKPGSGDQPTPGGGPQDDQDSRSDAQNFALVAGQILGAASACEQINEQRVSAATQKAVKMAKDTADDEQDIRAAQQYMLDAADSGRNAVNNGDAECDRVQESFDKLEQIEQNNDALQSQLDDPDSPSKSNGDDQSGDQDGDE